MDDIDAMFSDLLGEMDLLTQVGQGQLSDMKGIIAIYIYQFAIHYFQQGLNYYIIHASHATHIEGSNTFSVVNSLTIFFK